MSSTFPPDSPEPSGERARTRRRRQRRRRLARTAITLAVVVVVLAGAGVIYVAYRNSQIQRVAVPHLAPQTPSKAATASHPSVPAGPINILLVGDNCRSCLNGKQSKAFGTGAEVGGGRSDVTMILHLDAATHSVTIFSIPRDSWMPIPGTTNAIRVDDALNHGPGTLVQTIEDDLGIPINRFVELNFDTFQSVVQTLGGVDMYCPVPVRDYYSGLDVPASGCYHLDGFQALALVRARHLYYWVNGVRYYDGLGDISRIKRDHEFLKVLASELLHQGLLNPLKLNAVLGNVLPDLTVDSGFGISQMLGMALTFGGLNPNKVPTATMPVYIQNSSFIYQGANYGDVVFPTEPFDLQTIHEMLGLTPPAIQKGTTVSVLDGSGVAGQATTLASQLGGLGYKVVGTGVAPVVSSPAQSIVYYAPGHEAQAEALLSHLTGLVVMGEAPLPAGQDLRVVTGSNLAVSSTPAVTASAPVLGTQKAHHTSSSTTTTAPRVSTAPVTTPTTLGAANFPGNIVNVISPHETLPQWDPRACPSGMVAKPLTYNAHAVH